MFNRYFIIHKPPNMVSQFIGNEKNARLLGDLEFDFPEGIHAIGRLDSMSEGLLILTTNKKVTKLLFQSKTPHTRTYLVRVANAVPPEKLQQLKTGVTIHIKGDVDYVTTPCDAEIVELPAIFQQPEKEATRYIPHTWLRITLTEGKYHQIRKMVFNVGHRCQRLIRVAIEDLLLDDLPAGKVKEIAEKEFFALLKIDEY
jgi:23S rRNA pseudouridine2457 synthase